MNRLSYSWVWMSKIWERENDKMLGLFSAGTGSVYKEHPTCSWWNINLPLLFSPIHKATLSAVTMTMLPPPSNLFILNVWTQGGEAVHNSCRTHTHVSPIKSPRGQGYSPYGSDSQKKDCVYLKRLEAQDRTTITTHIPPPPPLISKGFSLWEKLFSFWTTFGLLTEDDDSMGSPSFC